MKKSSILNVFTFFITICVCVSVAYLIASTIISTNQRATAVSRAKTTLYAVSIQNAESSEELSMSKFDLQAKGGAGYVYCQDEKYYLLASLYENQADAKKVKQNFISSGIAAEIIELSLPSAKLNGSFSAEQKEVLSKTLKADLEIYQALYDISISLDTAICDDAKAKLDCSDVFASLVSTKSNFEAFFKDLLSSDSFSSLYSDLKTSETLLANLISDSKDTKSQTFSSLIKLTYFKVLFD